MLLDKGAGVTISVQLVYPMCVMFLLTVMTLAKMFLARRHAIISGQMKMSYFKTFTGGEQSEEVLKTGRHFSNLLEAPVLFYVACILGMIIPLQGLAFTILAWVYVALRCVHSYIHLGYNKVMHRLRAYALSWLILIAMWISIFIKVISISQ